jgi:pyridoxamine 5'-phosphate oxidase
MGGDDIAALRREYADHGLSEDDLAADPVTMFRRWFDEARSAGLYEPNAMVVATVFFTNRRSRKGEDLAGEPRCALLFPWHPLERQVRVEGTATEVAREEVAAYFATRPRGSRLGAHASHQSRVVASRAELDEAWVSADATYPDDVPVPEEWGGYRVLPEVVEFWQGRPGRMHDRLVYRRDADGWRTERLAP